MSLSLKWKKTLTAAAYLATIASVPTLLALMDETPKNATAASQPKAPAPTPCAPRS